MSTLKLSRTFSSFWSLIFTSLTHLPIKYNSPWVVVVQWLSHVQLFATVWTAARRAFLSFTISQSLLKFMSIELVMPSNHFILCCPLLLLLSIFPIIRVSSNELALCIRWPKYWSFSFSICPSNDYSRLISFRIDWFDLLVVQGTLKSLLQDHSSKAWVLQCSAFFMVHHVKLMTGPHSGYFKETRPVPTKLWN